MADLDDFFAKKDKKKSKVKKFTASELLTTTTRPVQLPQDEPSAAQTAAQARKPAKKEDEQEATDGGAEPASAQENPPAAARSTRAPADPEEEEWGEFEQEKERDYSGLKIQKLQIQDSEEEEEDDMAEHELNEEGELVKKEPSGPWNKIISTQQTSSNVKVKEAPQVVEMPNTAGGVYIPPSMRNKAAGGAGASSSSASTRTRTGKKDKGAPDLNSEEFFPTLSAAVAIEQNNFKLKKFEQTERGFTEAKPSRSHSNRLAGGTMADEGPRLNLGNKFNALSNDD